MDRPPPDQPERRGDAAPEPERDRGPSGPRDAAAAAIVGVSLSGLSPLLGARRAMPPPPEPAPIVRRERWQWADPVPALLRFGGWTFEEATYDLEVARLFGRIWDLRRDFERLRAEDRRDEEPALGRWWRRQGCPVPCPDCGAEGPCDCR